MDTDQKRLALAAALLSANDLEAKQVRARGEERACALANRRMQQAAKLLKASKAREVCFPSAEFERRLPRAYTSDDGDDPGTVCVSKASLGEQAWAQVERYESEALGCITKKTTRMLPK